MDDQNDANEEDAAPKRILLQGMDDVEDQDDVDVTMIDSNSTANPNASSYKTPATATLLAQIVTPSPFQHHNDSGTADRYRSALQRITSAPTTDVEAWEAIMNECMSLYRTQLLPQLEVARHASKDLLDQNRNGRLMIKREEELEMKLDWVESCYGNLLKYFPYSSNYFISAVDILLARSALPFESLTGGDDDYNYGSMGNWVQGQTPLQVAAAKKIDKIFEQALGVKMDGSPADLNLDDDMIEEEDVPTANQNQNGEKEEDSKQSAMQALGGMCSSSIELWLLYIRKRTRDAKREALLHHSTLIPTMDHSNPTKPSTTIQLNKEGEELIRDWITGAYETVLANGASYVFNNHLVWRQYLGFVKSWNVMQAQPAGNMGQEPIAGIDHSLVSKQKALLRSIYQRIITLPMLGLDGLWVEYENFEKAQSEQLAVALIAENLPKYQHARSVYLERNRVYSVHELRLGRLATPPVDYEFINVDVGGGGKKDIDEGEYKNKMKDEIDLLTKWKRRCAYERTNPERLSGGELTARIRQCYKDSVCCFMRHIEVWHEWSTWEFVNAGGSGAASSGTVMSAKKRNLNLAISVLELAQKHAPDSTLLAYTHAELLEIQSPGGKKSGSPSPGEESIQVMRDFCERAGNTLGYVLLQRLVRKYKGIKQARAVFSEARRKLRSRPEDIIDDVDAKGTAEMDAQGGDTGVQGTADVAGQAKTDGITSENGSGSKIVMNRNAFTEASTAGTDAALDGENGSPSVAKTMGYLTWHLYASHATMEHRLNMSPQVAARVYELGLKKHRSFLSTPQYVLQYSSLLLELNDEENLRALLTRAISACEEENENDADDPFGSEESGKAAARRELQRPLWDMMLKFESTLSTRSGDSSAFRAIEARRRKALYGPNCEDVSSGSTSGKESGDIGIGVQKTSLSETLIRADGYDNSSRIVNGLGRLVDTLEVSGILGQESIASALSTFASIKPGSIWKDDGCGGLSDTSYRRRKLYQTEMFSLESMSAGGANIGVGLRGASSSGKLVSAKERLAQSAALSQSTSVMAAVQGSPEWLRGMLMLLPATIRNFRGKAPPHMIEMALAALKDNPLPAVRPAGKSGMSEKISGAATKRSRGNMNGYYSSDEEQNTGGNGYGSQFRARQKARLGAKS
jgi:hypothetical protein